MGVPIPDDVRLKGPFKPMRFEATIEDCVVSEGEIPRDLMGGFYRVGPTWRRPTKQGTNGVVTMDGMVQGLTFENGRADYRNRWIRTPKLVAEEKAGRGLFSWTDCKWGDWRDWGYGDVERDEYTRGISQATNIVNAFPFGGDVLTAGEQGGPPIAVDPLTLETKGIVPWSPRLSRGCAEPANEFDMTFTAHPKWDHATGELYGWSWRDERPYVTLHWVHVDGTVESRELWDAPYEALAHDIWLTKSYVVMPFQPMIVSRARVAEDRPILDWDESLPSVLALIPRDDIHGEIRWIKAEIEPQYVMHTLAATERDGKIMLDAPIFDRPPFAFEDRNRPGDGVPLFFAQAKSTMGRWTIHVESGNVTAERLSDEPAELPKVDERHYGQDYTWGYLIGGVAKRNGMSMNRVVAWNSARGQEGQYVLRQDRPAAVLEATFAPRTPDAPEGDGYIIVPVSHWADNRAEFVMFDTYDISAGPICRIELPFMIGWTPHGHWMDFR
jgi:carotenoid cleavage dioxygenase-like enzyme